MSHILLSCQFLERIGAGISGEVWKVRQSYRDEQFARMAALKISYRPMSSHEVAGEMEGLRLALSLDLPGLIKIFEVDDIFGRLGVLMELGDCTLWQRGLQLRHLPIIELVKHIKNISCTLDLLASNGVIHGGITPEEMLVCGDEVRLSDFSLLHLLGRPFPQHCSINLLTWACMSQEMRNRTPTLHSDQYSLAASYTTLRQLRLPLRNPNASDPILLSDLKSAEREVIAKALSVNPEARFASCAEFASSLERTVLGER